MTSLEPMYDVFLSFSGSDRSHGAELAAELRSQGLAVFVDEDEIECFDGITSSIEVALSRSKTLVAYYSADYAVRAACQRELMLVFVAGQRRGDPCGRIMVVNPEPGVDHLRPVELTNAKYVRPDLGMVEVAARIAKRVGKVQGSIGDLGQVVPTRWPADRPGFVRNFVGRYQELWELHSALHAAEFHMVQGTVSGSFAALCGLPGSGKTALVTNYAWQFAAAFPGGVHWVSLARARADPMSLRQLYLDEIGQFSGSQNGQSALLVVDDIPPGAGTEMLKVLPLPTDSAVRTVLISQENIFRDLLPVVPVGPLPTADAITLLDGYRRPDDDGSDEAARDAVVRDLGGNAGALVAAGKHLRDRRGLSSYQSFHRDLGLAGSPASEVFAQARGFLGRISQAELTLLRVVGRSGCTTYSSTDLVTRYGLDPAEMGTAQERLLRRSAATCTDDEWHLDGYLAHAASHQLMLDSPVHPSVPEPAYG